MDTKKINQELSRCLACKAKPCEKACPLHVSPCDFIRLAKDKNYTAAAANIAKKNPLPQTCGLICPSHLCQKACIRTRIDTPLEIPCLQAEIMHQGGYPELEIPLKVSKKAAVVGGGPAGLGALYELLLSGWTIDLYEQSSFLGGAMRLIPEHRLPKSILDFEINRLTSNDRVTIYLNTKITDFDNLKSKYDGIILALGEPTLRTLGIKGEEHCISYKQYLSHPEQYTGQKIAISGGGEVAFDCAITAKKQGSEKVEMFVRRRREDMRIQPRDQLELDHFDIIVHDLSSITKIEKSMQKLTLNIVKNYINEQGKAETCNGSEYSLSDYDILIQALGSYFPKENIPTGFYLAGDMNKPDGTVVQALASGQAAARQLIKG